MHQNPGRPDQGKTKTIKARSVYVYAPTEDMLASWKKAAKSYGMPLSGFLVELIDDAMRRNPKGISPREAIQASLDQAMKNLAAERKEKESLKALLAQHEKSIAIYRDSSFKAAEQSEDEKLLHGLVELFHEHTVWRVNDLPQALGLSASNPEDMKRLNSATDRLKKLGVVEGDFETVRCRIGAKKKIPKGRHTVRAARARKRHAGVPRGLRPADDDDRDNPFVQVDAP